MTEGNALHSGSEALPSSFRDPSGFLFSRDGVILRQVNEVHKAHYDALMSSGLYEKLTSKHLLIPHEELPEPGPVPGIAYKVIKPEQIGFISYPYEWSFSQLQDAALLTLRIQSLALDHGMSLRDASAYNIQFHNGRPVLIDTLSFETLPEGRPWIAYRQFCQHFLAPLALMAYRDVRMNEMSRNHIDGIPLDLAASLLPMRSRFRMPLLIHIFGHAKSQKRHQKSGATGPPPDPKRTFTMQAFRGLLDSLKGAVTRLHLSRSDSHWVSYYAEAAHYTSEALDHKKELVRKFLAEAGVQEVWDLGANTGLFSRVATETGMKAIAFEMDAASVEENYQRTKANKETGILPLVMDLTNPSPGLGWHGEERMSLKERGPAPLVMALALIHHLAIANNVPLTRVADSFADLGRSLIIEFVPKEDEKVQELLATREDIFPTYTREGFEEAFATRFDTIRSEPISGTGRVLYLMNKR